MQPLVVFGVNDKLTHIPLFSMNAPPGTSTVHCRDRKSVDVTPSLRYQASSSTRRAVLAIFRGFGVFYVVSSAPEARMTVGMETAPFIGFFA